jgi:hypothetical protein
MILFLLLVLLLACALGQRRVEESGRTRARGSARRDLKVLGHGLLFTYEDRRELVYYEAYDDF